MIRLFKIVYAFEILFSVWYLAKTFNQLLYTSYIPVAPLDIFVYAACTCLRASIFFDLIVKSYTLLVFCGLIVYSIGNAFAIELVDIGGLSKLHFSQTFWLVVIAGTTSALGFVICVCVIWKAGKEHKMGSGDRSKTNS